MIIKRENNEITLTFEELQAAAEEFRRFEEQEHASYFLHDEIFLMGDDEFRIRFGFNRDDAANINSTNCLVEKIVAVFKDSYEQGQAKDHIHNGWRNAVRQVLTETEENRKIPVDQFGEYISAVYENMPHSIKMMAKTSIDFAGSHANSFEELQDFLMALLIPHVDESLIRRVVPAKSDPK